MYRFDVTGCGLIGARTVRNHDDAIELSSQGRDQLAVMEAWGIETPTENGDATGHAGLSPRAMVAASYTSGQGQQTKSAERDGPCRRMDRQL